MKIASLALMAAFHPAAEPLQDQTPRFSCAVIKRLVEKHGEEAVIMAARVRGVPEHVIEAVKRRCL